MKRSQRVPCSISQGQHGSRPDFSPEGLGPSCEHTEINSGLLPCWAPHGTPSSGKADEASPLWPEAKLDCLAHLHARMSQRINVLRAYRECVALARTRSSAEQTTILNDVRSTIRKHKDVSSSEASDHLKALIARVSFLRMTTPRHSLPSRSRLGHSHYVFRDGELKEGRAEAETK